MKITVGTANGVYYCEPCREVFPHLDALLDHVRVVHQNVTEIVESE